MSVLLETVNLSFAYRGQEPLFKNIDFTLKKGEIVGITGDSGSGKTTLLNCLAGIIPHIYDGELEGGVFLMGENISGLKLPDIAVKLGVLFQNPDTQLFSGAVEDDIVFGPENVCRPWQEINDNLESSLKTTGMEEKRLENPKSLSGGEAQLAALASTVALKPEILLFDEVMSCLDKNGVKAVQDCAVALRSAGKGIVITGHSEEHFKIADRVLYIENGALRGDLI